MFSWSRSKNQSQSDKSKSGGFQLDLGRSFAPKPIPQFWVQTSCSLFLYHRLHRTLLTGMISSKSMTLTDCGVCCSQFENTREVGRLTTLYNLPPRSINLLCLTLQQIRSPSSDFFYWMNFFYLLLSFIKIHI